MELGNKGQALAYLVIVLFLIVLFFVILYIFAHDIYQAFINVISEIRRAIIGG